MKEYYHITFGELVRIKKIAKMSMREAIPEIIKIREEHDFSHKQVVNLLSIARSFNPKYVRL